MRYAAFLRAVSPMNAKMPELKRCFEAAGFTNVVTVISSGNVVFDARPAPLAALERRAEASMGRRLAKPFLTIVRRVDELRALLERDPFRAFRVPANAKRIVTFVRGGKPAVKLPIEREGARILAIEAGEVFSFYTPGPRGPVFMTLIEKTFGAQVTTRTWETVRKVSHR